MDLKHENIQMKYLKLLSKKFKNIPDTATEIINLQAILNLPKGTEHFLTDIHGEYDAFNHVLKNGSGSIRSKIDDIFKDSITVFEKKELASVIYYPKEKIEYVRNTMENMDKWFKKIIYRMIEVASVTASKYTSSKVRRSMTPDFAYILQEVLYERRELPNRKEYVESIIDTIIGLKRAQAFVVAISNLIQRLSIDKLHIVGDIYDRGPYPDKIMDKLMSFHDVDIQWGNHDMLWMGAALGNKACVANVVRICARYANTDILEEAYGINLLPLARFVMDTYANDECKSFIPKSNKKDDLMAKIHKGISIIQFKIEGIIASRHKEFDLNDRQLLSKIDYRRGTINLDGKEYELNDTYFPTIDPNDPYKLTCEEEYVINSLTHYFLNSERLQRHIQFFLTNGSIYLSYNSNLLYHGCIPLKDNGEFMDVFINNKYLHGKKYLDEIEKIVRTAYFQKKNEITDSFEVDFLWYLWCGKYSPLFGKNAMKTFERYFIDDKETHVENKNPYYTYCNSEKTCDMILEEFDLNPNISHIVNGHMPVKTIKGEEPVKANGKLFVIDGGFSKAYQKQTGIAGFTLVYNSYGLKLISHEPFESIEKSVREGRDIISFTSIVEDTSLNRIRVKDTDIGKELQSQINDLKKLLNAYKHGTLMEKY